MRPLRTAVWVGALAAAVGGSPARAAWNNVFQVCCHGCRTPASTSYYADPYTPQQACTTRYVQRSYYQPVTTYENRTQWEQVTSYRTSYYWEPVTSYRVSCYYDPSTCSYQQASVPVTSYRMRSQCCPVQNWVSRCVSVPVTSQQLMTYYEPVTTCCTTTTGAPVWSPPASAATTPAPVMPPEPSNGRPGVNEYRNLPPGPSGAGGGDTRDGGTGRLRPYDANAPQVGTRQYFAPSAPRTGPPAAPPRVRLDKIVGLPRPNVEGEVVRADERGEPGARLLFRRVDRRSETESVKADGRGLFRATLASGVWDVFTHGADGILVTQTRIEVRDDEPRQLRLTSR